MATREAQRLTHQPTTQTTGQPPNKEAGAAHESETPQKTPTKSSEEEVAIDILDASDTDFVAICKKAIRDKDWGTVMKVLSETDMYEDDLKLKICFRAAKWQCAWDCVVHIFALTESDKDFTNYFVNDLLQLMAHYVGNGPLYCRTFVRHLHKTGHTAFAFDLALTFGTWEEALLIVSDVEENGADFVWMLLDVASQVTSDHVTRFIDRCLQVGLSDFALALSAVLKQWSRVVEIAKSGELTSNAFTGPVFRSAIIAGCWEVVEYFLDMLTEDDIALETRYIPRTVDISPLLDQLVSHGHTPLAMKVASLYGHWNKALDILRNAPKTKVITWFARRAFEADIPTLEDFMSVGLDLELKRAMLGRPQAMTFTENQWSCVMRLVEDGCLDDHVLQWVVRKAVDEDCHCLKRLIGQGEPPVDYQLMTAILTTDLSTSLSENKWSCVEELLRKEAEEKLARKKLESSGRASCRLSVVQEGKALLGEVREEQMLDENGTVRPQSKRKSCIEPIDFTSSLEKSGNSDLENYLKDPWNRVTSTLDRMVGSSQYLMMLCERAAQEEKWLALKWLTSSHCELRENALDRIFRVKHRSSDDDESDEDDVSSTDGFLDYQYGGLDTRWTSFDFHALEAVHVICFQASHSHEDDLMQDRHKIVLLRRALQLGHWHKVEEIVSCGLFPSQRPWVYKMAAEAQKWSVALQVLDQGLEEIPARHWVHPAKSIKDLTSQETAFVERGLCNSYFTSNLFSSESGTGGGNPRQGAGCIARGADNPKTESPRKHDPAGKNAMDSVSQSTSKSRSDHTPKPGDKTSRRRLPATVLSGMKRLGGLLKPDTPTVGGKLKRKVTKISSLEKKLLKAAVKGEWALVMSVYQAGLHEDVKMQVFDEAVRQQKWHIVTTLIRRDPEASTLTHHYIQAVYDPEGCLHTELLEALVKRGIPHDERDRLAELCLMNRWWPQFLVLTQAGISGELRSKGLQEVLRRNEWTFVADYIKTDFVFDGERLIILEQALAKRIWPVVTSLVTPTIPKAKVSEIIFEAVKVGKQSVVEECMKRCAHDGRGSPEMTCAGGKGERFDLDQYRDEDGNTALQLAARQGMWSTVRLLLDLGADADPPPTPSCPLPVLVRAARKQQVDVITRLLDAGAKAEGRESVLHELILRGPSPDHVMQALCKLLRKGANPTEVLCDEIPFTPLRSALESDRLFVGKERDKERLSEEIVRLLIEAGASVYQASMSDNLYAMPRSKIFKPPCTPLAFPQPPLSLDEKPAQQPGQQRTQELAEDPAQRSAQKLALDPAQQPGQQRTQELAENPAQHPGQQLTQELAENPAQQPGQQLAQELAEDSAQQLAQEPAENPAQHPGQQLAQELAEDPAQQLAQELAEDPAQQLAQELAEDPSQQPGQQRTQKLAEDPSQQPGQQRTQKLAEDPAQQPGQQLAQELAEDPAQQPGQELAQDPAPHSGHQLAQQPTQQLAQEPCLQSVQSVDVCTASPVPCTPSENIFCSSPVFKTPEIVVVPASGPPSPQQPSPQQPCEKLTHRVSSAAASAIPQVTSPPVRPPRRSRESTSASTRPPPPRALSLYAPSSTPLPLPPRCPISPISPPPPPLPSPSSLHRPPPPPPPMTSSLNEPSCLGVEDYSVAKRLSDNCPVYLYLHGYQGCSPMKKALDMGRLSTVKLLHQSGASSTSEIQRWYSSATCSILPDKDDKLREVLDYVQTILASPASLKHQCRLFVSRMIGWRDRHARVRQLPVTPEVQDYVMFLDVLSSEDGAHVYQWKLSDVES